MLSPGFGPGEVFDAFRVDENGLRCCLTKWAGDDEEWTRNAGWFDNRLMILQLARCICNFIADIFVSALLAMFCIRTSFTWKCFELSYHRYLKTTATRKHRESMGFRKNTCAMRELKF